MALRDYQKLCPKSGHALTEVERKALEAGGRTASRARRVRCDACGREIELCPDPGTGRSLLYAMHLKDGAEGTRPCKSGAA
jgi:hypothetical protein